MTTELDNETWPRIYSTTMAERMNMAQVELEALWQEYRLFWIDHTETRRTKTTNAVLDYEYSRDWLEDKDSTYR